MHERKRGVNLKTALGLNIKQGQTGGNSHFWPDGDFNI